MQHLPDLDPALEIAPLHEVIFGWSRRLWANPQPKLTVSNVRDEGSLTQQMQKLTAQQLATSLRMHGAEDDGMLESLEGMALAGELSFEEFATRVKNLYPKIYENLDVTLRMKIAALVYPESR